MFRQRAFCPPSQSSSPRGRCVNSPSGTENAERHSTPGTACTSHLPAREQASHSGLVRKEARPGLGLGGAAPGLLSAWRRYATPLRHGLGGAMAAAILSGCTSAYIPFSVERVTPLDAPANAAPRVDLQPIPLQSADYRAYRDITSGRVWLVPTRLEVASGRIKSDAVFLERNDGEHGALIAVLRPPPAPLEELAAANIQDFAMYPIDRMSVRTVTSLGDSTVHRVTIAEAVVRDQPFVFPIVIQALGAQEVEDLKLALRGRLGFQMEVSFALYGPDGRAIEMGAPAVLNQIQVTNQTR